MGIVVVKDMFALRVLISTRLYNCGCAEHPSLRDMLQELDLTYKFLFGSYEDFKIARKIRKIYGQQSAPGWIAGFHSNERIAHGWRNKWFSKGHSLSDYIDIDNVDPSSDIGLHLTHTSVNVIPAVREYTHLTETTSYLQFPIHQHRIRALKQYMDQQKARSLRDLWRDKRDTLSWYTFWAVIIIGGVGLLLTLASLGVSSAQTAAAFRALNLPTNRIESDTPPWTHQMDVLSNIILAVIIYRDGFTIDTIFHHDPRHIKEGVIDDGRALIRGLGCHFLLNPQWVQSRDRSVSWWIGRLWIKT